MAGDPNRLPDDIALGPVHLQVADLGRSLEWYERVLGFRLLERGEGRAGLGARGDAAPLLLLSERPRAAPAGRRRRLGLYHFAILLPDRAALGRLATHLIGAGVRMGASDHLVSEALYLADPDDLGIEVYADRPRDTWRSRGGELVMSTEPLDLADLQAAGSGAGWTGMPPGTRVGHLHLHVGSLDEAARFYQDALGLSATVRGYPGALFLSAGGYHHHLGLNTWAGPPAAPPDDADAAAGSGWRLSDPWGTVLRLEPASAP